MSKDPVFSLITPTGVPSKSDRLFDSEILES